MKNINDGCKIKGDVIFKKVDGNAKQEDHIVYFKDSDNKIVINLNGVKKKDRARKAQKQFENILNSGLLENSEYLVDNFKTCSKLMPGIAVKIPDGIGGTFPVMYAKKQKCCCIATKPEIQELEQLEDNARKAFGESIYIDQELWGRLDGVKTIIDGTSFFLTRQSWEWIFKGIGFWLRASSYCDSSTPSVFAVEEKRREFAFLQLDNAEHTERQLSFSMLHDNAVLCLENENLHRLPRVDPMKCSGLYGAMFLIWTKENPCITHDGDHDNGGFCCAQWYKDMASCVAQKFKVAVYFANKEARGTSVTVGDREANENTPIKIKWVDGGQGCQGLIKIFGDDITSELNGKKEFSKDATDAITLRGGAVFTCL